MSGIKLPIEVGQKFVSNGKEVEIVCVKGKRDGFPLIDNFGTLYTADGGYQGAGKDQRDLQPLPVTITEGVEFCGEQYRAEFERLAAEGRGLEVLGNCGWTPCKPEFFATVRYRLAPQHRDAVGNPLKVGDRVEAVDGGAGRYTIERIECRDGQCFLYDSMLFGNARGFRKLTTRTRPLCAADLDKASCPQFIYHGVRGFPAWCALYVSCNGWRFNYSRLVDECNWRPSSDQPWGPCEVQEEVLA